MTAEDAKAYLAEKEIPQLMESLITGLMYHRPDDPLQFLEDCLSIVRRVGIDKVKWNSFIDESKKLAYINTRVTETEKNHPQVIILMGPPGGGKNIQLQKIAKKYKEFVCMSVGTLLRTQYEKHTKDEHWRIIMAQINKGEMVEQSVVLGVILKEMDAKPSAYYVIDGTPRSVAQAEDFGKSIGKINIVFLLDCSEEYCRQRLLQKREIESRGDDTDQAIEQRMQVFKEVTLPMLKRYDDNKQLHYINGEKEEDEVFQEMCKIIEHKMKEAFHVQ